MQRYYELLKGANNYRKCNNFHKKNPDFVGTKWQVVRHNKKTLYICTGKNEIIKQHTQI
jgi:hypothetical protein